MSTMRIVALLCLIGVSACSPEPEPLFNGDILAQKASAEEPVDTAPSAQELSSGELRPTCKGVMIGGAVVSVAGHHIINGGCMVRYNAEPLALYLEDNPDEEVAHIAFDGEGRITTAIVRKRSPQR